MSHNFEFILLIIIAFIMIYHVITMAIVINKNNKSKVYVDKTWRGFNIEHFRFINRDGTIVIFVIFSGLKSRLEGGEILELEGEMEDLGILPMFPKKDTNYLPTVYLVDRNNGYKYKYCGKYAKVKFERCK